MVKRDVTPRLVNAWFTKVEDIINDLKSSEDDRMKSVSEELLTKAKEMAKKGGSQILQELVKKGNLHQLEYCLALHAEENAIIQSSKIGGMGLKGGSIYTTAQPCPLCTKKYSK